MILRIKMVCLEEGVLKKVNWRQKKKKINLKLKTPIIWKDTMFLYKDVSWDYLSRIIVIIIVWIKNERLRNTYWVKNWGISKF